MAAYFQDGKLLFVGGKVAMHADCCCGDLCSACTGDTPSQLRVVIAGITNGFCSTCNGLNGDFVLDFEEEDEFHCKWTYTFPSAVCLQTGIRLTFEGGALFVDFTGGFFAVPKFSSTTLSANCTTWSSEDVPLTSFDIDARCKAEVTPATCTLTAL